jgi:polysaccharide biosynthesis protein PslG
MALQNIGFNQVELSTYGEGGLPPAADLPTVVAGLVSVGATWVRIGAFWEIIETAPGTYDWSGLDAALAAVTAAGMTPLLCITNTPFWSPTPAAFAAFCTTAVNRYGPGTTVLSSPLRHWEIWNEPNDLLSAPPGQNPAGMFAYQQAAYNAIHAVDTGAQVGSAGLLPVTSGFGTTDAVTWLIDMYAAVPPGSTPPWDFVCFHPYSSTNAGAQEPITSQVWIAEIPALYQVMVANGDGPTGRNLKIWLTEFGFFTQPNGQAAGIFVTPTQQAQWLDEQINNMEAVAAAAGVPLGPAMFIYNYRDSQADDGAGTSSNGSGIVTYNFTPKPSWNAMQALISGGAPVGVLSGTGVLNVTPTVADTGTGPTGVKVGAGTDRISIAGTGAGAVAIPGQATAVWGALGIALNPIAAPMTSLQTLADEVVGIPGATATALAGAISDAIAAAGSAAKDASQAGGDLLTLFAGLGGDLAATVENALANLTGTNTNGVANTNAITALQSQGISGMSGINYNFTNTTPLTNNYAGPYATGVSPAPAWTTPAGSPSTVFSGANYIINTNSSPAPIVFTGNPEGSGTDHGLTTNKSQVFVTIEAPFDGTAAIFLGGHGTTTLGQNVELVFTITNSILTAQINTATGPYSGLTARGTPYTLGVQPQSGDIIGLQIDGSAHYTMIYNNTAVGLASGQTYSWYDSGAVISVGAGNRESGLILFSNGFGAGTIGLGGTFNAADYTGVGIT